jgi:hypothetical protein
VADHLGRAAGAQQITVIDAVCAQRHRADQRQRLGALAAGTGPVAEIDALVDQVFDAKALGERRDQRDPGAGNRPPSSNCTSIASSPDGPPCCTMKVTS